MGRLYQFLVFAGIISYLGLDGSLLKKSRKLGNTIQKLVAFSFIAIGVLDTITYWF
ncbi:hypothetical protein [Bacillus sp. B15-48]|uniref:hypothetical protein n=1 Tax=Bacillus sp. B15-48 TaxID=1548601 RepID=UPI00193FFF8F|nr:hypothetical protein [Bacillus sp. B15-48]MBM4763307.1 hypothetical protein [Bacillus sp. B15-48]